MKVLFFYIGTPTPILETEFELIRDHENNGDLVRVIQCAGNLPSCHWNPKHRASKCLVCSSKFKNGWKMLNAKKNVELKQFTLRNLKNEFKEVNFKLVDEIKLFKHDNQNVGFGVASTLTSILRDHRFDTKKYKLEVNLGLKTAIHVYDSMKNEIEDFQPDLVYIFNGRIMTHLPVKLLCLHKGIDFISYEVGNKKDHYRLLKNRTVHEVVPLAEVSRIDKIWKKDYEVIGESYYQAKRYGGVNDTLSFTRYQIKDSLPLGFDEKKNNIAIFCGSIDEYSGIENCKNKIYQPDETAGISKILESFLSDITIMFYLRVHPNLKNLPRNTSQLVDIEKLSRDYKNLYVIWPWDEIDSYALMSVCNKTLTFGSTMGIEATFWGKPSILADQATYENFSYAYKATSHEHVVQMIRDDIAPLPRLSSLKIRYYELSNGIPLKYFKGTGIRNNLAFGTFDNIEIKADKAIIFWYSVNVLLRGILRCIKSPLLLFQIRKHISLNMFRP